MLVIRLSRTGRKKQPYYRVVVAEKSAPIKGRLIEVLGHFNPRTKEVKIDVDRAKERVAAGAQPSETAEALLEKAGVLKRAAITEQNRRPERKSRKAIKAEAEGGDEPAAAPKADGDAAPADGDAKTDGEAKSDATKGDDSADDEAKSDDAAADDSAKADDGAAADAKPAEKEEAKSDDKAKQDDKAADAKPEANDNEGDSK